MADEEFEAPLFKRLSKTDANEGKSHVAGILIPVELRPYFPRLPEPSDTAVAPAIPISVTLIVSGKAPEYATASYQYQTRGNKRPPESRLTGGIDSFRKVASTGDYALFERSSSRDDLFRVTLVGKSDPHHSSVASKAKGAISGVLDKSTPPIQLPAVEAAIAEIEAKSGSAFQLFDDQAQWMPQGRRIARARAFRKVVNTAYGGRCAMCGSGLTHPKGRSEIEAAHIVSRSARGADDVRNGLALCRLHHWAFDNLLVGVRPNGSLVMSDAAAALSENAALVPLTGTQLQPPNDPAQAPHPDALAWASERFDLEWPDG